MYCIAIFQLCFINKTKLSKKGCNHNEKCTSVISTVCTVLLDHFEIKIQVEAIVQ